MKLVCSILILCLMISSVQTQDLKMIKQMLQFLGLGDVFGNGTNPDMIKKGLANIDLKALVNNPMIAGMVQQNGIDPKVLNVIVSNINMTTIMNSIDITNIITGVMANNQSDVINTVLKNVNFDTVFTGIDLKKILTDNTVLSTIQNLTKLQSPTILKSIVSNVDFPELLASVQWKDFLSMLRNISDASEISKTIQTALLKHINMKKAIDSIDIQNILKNKEIGILFQKQTGLDPKMLQMLMSVVNIGDLLQNVDVTKLLQSIQTGNMTEIYKILMKKMDFTTLMKDLNFENILKMVSPMMLSAANISSSCVNAFSMLMKSGNPVILDAWGKPPSGVMQGNINWLGAYRQCKAMENTKYCLAGMQFSFLPILAGTYGSCLPRSCSYEDNLKIISTIFKALPFVTITREKSGVTCEEPIKYKTGFIVTLLLCAVILTLCILGTVVDMLGLTNKRQQAYTVNGEPQVNGHSNIGLTKFESDSDALNSEGNEENKQGEVTLSKEETDRSNFLVKFFLCFSLLRNNRAILATKLPKGGIGSINGIRAISMTWVILGHTYIFMFVSSPPDNLVVTVDVMRRYSFMAIANAYVSVDTFFVLSGLLVSYLALKRMDKNNGKLNIPMFYLHRFIRLTPPYMFVILFWNNVFPMILSGPKSSSWRKDGFQEPCNNYWWTNLLYINNLYPHEIEKECLGWSWYLANDMQFYVASPLFLYIVYYFDRKYERSKYRFMGSYVVTFTVCLICVIINVCLYSINNYPALTTAAFIPGNPRAAKTGEGSNVVYIKPWTRIAPYVVGLFLGYVLSRKIEIKSNHKKIIIFFGWLMAFALAYSVIYAPYSVFKPGGEYLTDVQTVAYGSLHRLAFGIVVAWVIYACHTKAAGLINDFLSWRVFIPLSRLTFGAYLLHSLVVFYFYFAFETPIHYQDNLWVYHFISNTVLSYACAYILAICVEYPVLNLEKLAFKL